MHSFFLKARSTLDSNGVFEHGAVPEAIANSWHRCLENGLDPQGKPIDASISHEELRQAREKHEKLMAVVRPELELLSNQISGTNYLMAFADRTGVVLDAIMDHQFGESECSRSVRNGTIWNEELRGTNALGLALHTGKTSMVTGKEHFLANHAGVSCVAAPIFDSQGVIVGLLDASSEVAARQLHTKALVSLAATNIENRLFVDDHRSDFIVQFHPREEYLLTQSVGMVSLDQDGRITGVNRCASELLSGIDLIGIRTFSDLFQGGVGATISAMKSGKVIRLVDWLYSSYFARIRTNNPRTSHRDATLSVPLVYEMPKVDVDPIFHDDQARNCLRLGIRSVRAGLPLCITGAPGSGRTTLAKTIHAELHGESPLIAIDCQTTNFSNHADQITAEILTAGEGREGFENDRGTLVIENLAKARDGAAERLVQIFNYLLQSNAKPGWAIISTETTGHESCAEWPTHVQVSFARLRQMIVHLPNLCERSDFSLVAARILANISSEHQLSKSAILALQMFDRKKNLTDLTNQLRVLVVQCPTGVIRKEHVERHLGQSHISKTACNKCIGNSAREAKCLKINRVFQQCNANVALASRKLGISRNTVYAHIPK